MTNEMKPIERSRVFFQIRIGKIKLTIERILGEYERVTIRESDREHEYRLIPTNEENGHHKGKDNQ